MSYKTAVEIMRRAIGRAGSEDFYDVLACLGDLNKSGRDTRVVDCTQLSTTIRNVIRDNSILVLKSRYKEGEHRYSRWSGMMAWLIEDNAPSHSKAAEVLKKGREESVDYYWVGWYSCGFFRSCSIDRNPNGKLTWAENKRKFLHNPKDSN